MTVIKSRFDDYLEKAPNEEIHTEDCDVSEDKKRDESGKEVLQSITIFSPITGIAANLSTAPDEAFAGKMMGDGAVVTPEDAVITAPENGTVEFVMDTKHAIGFRTDSGIGLLFHIGIDTVKLNGKGFEVFVENEQKVKKGDKLLSIDIDYLKENAPSICSPIICTELEENQKVRLLAEGHVKAGEPLFAVDTY